MTPSVICSRGVKHLGSPCSQWSEVAWGRHLGPSAEPPLNKNPSHLTLTKNPEQGTIPARAAKKMAYIY